MTEITSGKALLVIGGVTLTIGLLLPENVVTTAETCVPDQFGNYYCSQSEVTARNFWKGVFLLIGLLAGGAGIPLAVDEAKENEVKK